MEYINIWLNGKEYVGRGEGVLLISFVHLGADDGFSWHFGHWQVASPFIKWMFIAQIKATRHHWHRCMERLLGCNNSRVGVGGGGSREATFRIGQYEI